MKRKISLLLGLVSCITAFGQGYKVYQTNGKVDAYPGATARQVTLNDDAFRYEGHEYIDLGLPSGTRWAAENMGTDSRFAMGRHYTGSAAEDGWGGDWRLPSVAEWQELQEKCTWKWTSRGNVRGYDVTGPNGNTMFLPAAGHAGKDGDYNSGLLGLSAAYWAQDGQSFVFTEGNKGVAANNGSLRLSVRNVISAGVMQEQRNGVAPTDHEYVDMGTSVLWAKYDIGAAEPGGAGDCFMPFIPVPCNDSTIADVSMEYEDKFGRMASYIYSYLFPNIEDRYSEEYQRYILEVNRCFYSRFPMGCWTRPEHDAAKVLWGDGWRLPTMKEWKELFDNCILVSMQGDKIVLTAPNGQTITFRYKGMLHASQIDNNAFSLRWQSSDICSYLTSSVPGDYPIIATLGRNVNFQEWYNRELLLPIRPVRDRNIEDVADTPEQDETEMVDLGLSSKWASRNWKADTPQERGEYVAWGEIVPKAGYTAGNYQGLGYTTNLYRQMFGKESLRLPSRADMEELAGKCTWTPEGDGYRVTGPNGNSIYMPATGFRSGMSLGNTREATCYWTADSAQALYAGPGGTVSVRGMDVALGMAVRPVMPKYLPVTEDATSVGWNSAEVICTLDKDMTCKEIGVEYWICGAYEEQPYKSSKALADISKATGGRHRVSLTLQPAITYCYRAYAMTADSTFHYGDVKRLHTAEPPAVDLGLSVRWSPVNLGAETEYSTGLAYRWYQTPDTNSLPYTYWDRISTHTYEDMLLPKSSWSNEWKVPTKEQFEELVSKCKWEWCDGESDINTGVCRSGYRVTGPNGNSIFLNAGGRVVSNVSLETEGFGTHGYYQTSDWLPNSAYCILKISGSGAEHSFGADWYSIRPVKE